MVVGFYQHGVGFFFFRLPPVVRNGCGRRRLARWVFGFTLPRWGEGDGAIINWENTWKLKNYNKK